MIKSKFAVGSKKNIENKLYSNHAEETINCPFTSNNTPIYILFFRNGIFQGYDYAKHRQHFSRKNEPKNASSPWR